jgi:hypothetical protein
MPRIYKVEGEIKHDTFSMLSLKLGCIESRKINGREFAITIFKERDDVEKILADHGLRMLGVTDDHQENI